MKCNQFSGDKGLKKNNPRCRGLKQRGRGTWKKDKPPIVTIIETGTRNTILSVEKGTSPKN